MPDIMKNYLKKVRVSMLIYAILIVLMLLFALSLIVTYAVPESSQATEKFRDKLPYPAVIINYSDGISYRTLGENMLSIKNFYEAQDFSKVGLRVDFTTDEGKKRFKVREKEVLNKMIEDKVIMQLAEERDIRVTREEASQSVSRKLSEYGTGEEVKKDLERLYGWTLADFEEKIVIPGLYQEKLAGSFEKEVDSSGAGKKAISLAQEALRSGTPFGEVAKKHSEGNTAKDGGALGWFAIEDLALELRAPVATQKIGVPGDVIESSLGFHIVLVEEIKKEDEKQLYRVSQIFTKRVMFADWLTEKMRGLSIAVLSPEYYWNTEEARVEFKREELRDFEKNIFKKMDGDAAFFF